MKQLLKIILLFSVVLSCFENTYSQWGPIPSYAINIKNPFLSNGNKKLTFDIYLTNTSSDYSEFTGATYSFKLPQSFGVLGIGSGANSGYQYDSVGGTFISDFDVFFIPRNPSVAAITISGVPFYELKLSANIPLHAVYNLSPNDPKLVIRMKLISNNPFDLSNLCLMFRDSCNDNPIPTNRTKVKFLIGTNNVEVTRCVNHFVDFHAPVYCNVKLAIEGLYDPVLNIHNKKDDVTVHLRETISPYQIIDSSSSVVDSNTLSGDFTFLNTISPNIYYIVVKYKNSLETWSRNGGDTIFQGNNTYDFTDSSSKAFGNNLVLKGNKYCIYSGDINYDNYIEITDISAIDNDVFNLSQGDLITDLDGNNIVDIQDLATGDNNVSNYVAVINP
ncbi:MAG: hypothetical protein M3R36_05695 [Bacteroidota bacterium]|nr:hypothetical protein [Bacteroidota bacterium]